MDTACLFMSPQGKVKANAALLKKELDRRIMKIGKRNITDVICCHYKSPAAGVCKATWFLGFVIEYKAAA